MTKSRIIGIDYGLARLGVAYSDESKMIAMSMDTLKASKKSLETAHMLIAQLQKHANEYGYAIEEIVIGLPLMMSGKRGLLADEANHFASLLKEHTTFPVIMWDERLTSVQADRLLREGCLTRKKRAQKSDSVAAVIILQNYLDFRIQKQKQEHHL
jgi:putative Holliday junction resolvase